MSDLLLIDTSMWTCAMRKSGDAVHKQRVQALMKSGRAAWCDMVRLELWRGASSDHDRQMLGRLAADIPLLAINGETWETACRLANAGRKKGMQFPLADLVIFACARQHEVELLTRDKHFEELSDIWKRL